MQPGTVRTALVLGLLAAVGPFAIDMYLPALPRIADDLGAGAAGAQATLVAYFTAFGLAQLFYGPFADRAGRKLPLYLGLALFAAGSAGCALAPGVASLAGFRFLQGLGGAAVMVIPRAIIRDLHTGAEATKLMATVMLVISISPMLAPLAGSGMTAAFGWRAIFVALLVTAAISMVILALFQPETLPRERRMPVRLRVLRAGAGRLLSDPAFLGLTFVGGFGMSSFFVFLAGGAFVYTQQYGLSPTGFSLAFAVNAIGFFGASQAAGPLASRYGTMRVISAGVTGFAVFEALLLAVTLAGGATLPVLVGGLFLGNACLGLVVPSTMVMALDAHGDIAGLASSLGGTLQMLTGGAMIAAASPFLDATATPMVVAIAVCAAIALTLTRLVLGRVAVVTG